MIHKVPNDLAPLLLVALSMLDNPCSKHFCCGVQLLLHLVMHSLCSFHDLTGSYRDLTQDTAQQATDHPGCKFQTWL
jgi:hypothetical protein